MSEDIDVLRRLFQAVERRDLDGLLACYDPNVEIHESPVLPYGGIYRGLDGARRHAVAFTKAWGRFQSERETRLEPRFISDGAGMVAVLFRHRARDAHTERSIDCPEISTYEVTDGKVTRFQMFHFDPGALTEFLDATARP